MWTYNEKSNFVSEITMMIVPSIKSEIKYNKNFICIISIIP